MFCIYLQSDGEYISTEIFSDPLCSFELLSTTVLIPPRQGHGDTVLQTDTNTTISVHCKHLSHSYRFDK